MLEAGETPALCRNGKWRSFNRGQPEVRYSSLTNVPEQELWEGFWPLLPAPERAGIFMSAPGVAVAEGIPRMARSVGMFPVMVGEGDRPWEPVAVHTGADRLYPVVAMGDPSAGNDVYRPAMAAAAVAGGVAEAGNRPMPEARPLPLRKQYFLGGVAVEAAGVLRADQLAGESDTKERYRQFLAGIALGASVERPDGTTRRSSLNILHDAARGDRESAAALLVDTQTHVAEILGGVGERFEVEQALDADGWPVWGGQNTVDRQFHTLTAYNDSPVIRRLRHAEGIGGWRLRDRNRDGQLAGKVVFDLSAPANASRDELLGAGYFLNSIGVCIRGTRFTEKSCKTASVFAAGVDQRKFRPRPNETEAQEAERQAAALRERFDIKVLRKIHQAFGTPGAETMEPDELLASQLVAPDTFDDIDMMMLYDQFAAEEMEEGVHTFFGSVELWEGIGSPETLTRAHYDAYLEAGKQRQAENETLCRNIVREQIRRAHEATTPLEAVELKRRVVLDMVVDQAATDNAIDETRLGRVAAGYINQARHHYAAGDTTAGDKYRNMAKKMAIDPSCPPGQRGGLPDLSGAAGEKDGDDDGWDGGKRYYNQKCNSCKKFKHVVGACKICKDCVSNPNRMQAAYDADRRAKDNASKKSLYGGGKQAAKAANQQKGRFSAPAKAMG